MNAQQIVTVSEMSNLKILSTCNMESTDNYLLNKWKNEVKQQNVFFIYDFIQLSDT